MRALALAVRKVLRLDEVDAGARPLLGERICVIDVHVDGSTADPPEIDAGPREMNRQFVAVSKRIPLVVMGGTEVQLLAWATARATSETTKIGSKLTTRRTPRS